MKTYAKLGIGAAILLAGIILFFFPRAVTSPVSTYTLKTATTTLFWVGESAGADNADISNTASFWDDHWQSDYGGVDAPDGRCGYVPCSFQPKENPFYFALPYAEFANGVLKENAVMIPWYRQAPPENMSLLKNRWIEVRNGTRVCYGQWEDVGPSEEDDVAYVFGSASTPKNTFGAKAGLDVSPAVWKCLGMTDNAATEWRFIEEKNVPAGAWKQTVTASEINWN